MGIAISASEFSEHLSRSLVYRNLIKVTTHIIFESHFPFTAEQVCRFDTFNFVELNSVWSTVIQNENAHANWYGYNNYL